MALITSDEYQDLLNEDISGKDAGYVAAILESAEANLKRWCGRSFEQESVTEETYASLGTYREFPVLKLQVRRIPVQSVTSLAVWYVLSSDDPLAIDINGTFIDGEIGLIQVGLGSFGTWRSILRTRDKYRARIVYVAGDGVIPAPIKRAVALLMQEAFALDAKSDAAGQALQGMTASLSVAGEYSETFARPEGSSSERLGLGTKNSLAAARLAKPYRVEGPLFL